MSNKKQTEQTSADVIPLADAARFVLSHELALDLAYQNFTSSGVNSDASAAATLLEKLNDALTPGFQAEFNPDEADKAGAFAEDALSEADATDSAYDYPASAAPAVPQK